MPTGVYPRTKEMNKRMSLSTMGHPTSDATRRKIGLANSIALKGKHTSPRTEIKKGQRLPGGGFPKGNTPWNKGKKSPYAGETHHWWKGGITPETRLLRVGLEYRLWREAVFTRDKYTCIWCKQKGGRLNADHIQKWSDRPDLRFAIDNGRTLCKRCHIKRHQIGELPKPKKDE